MILLHDAQHSALTRTHLKKRHPTQRPRARVASQEWSPGTPTKYSAKRVRLKSGSKLQHLVVGTRVRCQGMASWSESGSPARQRPSRTRGLAAADAAPPSCPFGESDRGGSAGRSRRPGNPCACRRTCTGGRSGEGGPGSRSTARTGEPAPAVEPLAGPSRALGHARAKASATPIGIEEMTPSFPVTDRALSRLLRRNQAKHQSRSRAFRLRHTRVRHQSR